MKEELMRKGERGLEPRPARTSLLGTSLRSTPENIYI